MKKIVIFALIMCTFILSSCNDSSIECDENEELVDGVCEVIKTPFEQTFDRMAVLDNYTLEITVQQLANLYTLTMEVDQTSASFEMDGIKEFFSNQNGTCYRYYPVDEGYRSEIIPCNGTDSAYDFFHGFEASWFMEVSGKYFLKSEFYGEVSAFFQTEIEGSNVANLELVLGDTYFEEIIFDVIVGDLYYRFEMTFDKIDSTVITIPVV